jgi:N-acetyl-anhydromuramyl-L-alanine amidase AmpD
MVARFLLRQVPKDGQFTQHRRNVMRRSLPGRLGWVLLVAVSFGSLAVHGESGPDFPGATWVKDPDYYTGRRLDSIDYEVEYIVIHATVGNTAEGAVAEFTNRDDKSTHYIVANGKGPLYRDGQVIQMVREADTAWSIGIWPAKSTGAHRGPIHHFNSISIELAGRPNEKGWCTERMYESAARLVRFLADEYGIPLSRDRILGHDEVARTSVPITTGKMDPCGSDPRQCTFDWDHFMSLVKQSPSTTPHAVSSLPSTPAPSVAPAATPSPAPPHSGSVGGTPQFVWPIILGTITVALLLLALFGFGGI